MLEKIIPKLPMKDKVATKNFYLKQLEFAELGDYGDYLLLAKDAVEVHFFIFEQLNPLQNYGQVYIRTKNIEAVYQAFLKKGVQIHPNDPLRSKPWKQKEFSLLDPDHNLLTFGEAE